MIHTVDYAQKNYNSRINVVGENIRARIRLSKFAQQIALIIINQCKHWQEITDESDYPPHTCRHKRNENLAQMLWATTFVRESEMKNDHRPPTDITLCNNCASRKNES